MAPGCFRFDRFLLNPADRRLTRDGVTVELNARYLDALALLVREQGRLVSKNRFLDEVWRGVPVTDEALTQCIRTIRRQLGDDAANPRFIETVPKHGYRFIAPVESPGPDATPPVTAAPASAPDAAPARSQPLFLQLGGAGMMGGAIAGVLGGLFYGLGAAQPLQSGMGASSIVLVLVVLTAAVGMIGGGGVGMGIAAARTAWGHASPGAIIGGAFGGLVIGAVVKLLGVDAFNLLFGQSPAAMTGAGEGALLGAAIGFGAWLSAARALSLRLTAAATALTGAVVGVLIPSFGGRLMGGSLDLLARQFPTSRLSLDPIGGLFGEAGFGPVSQAVTGGLEGALFCGFVVGTTILVQRRLAAARL
jgi:DNA-binding winged helix-turn-helix (wHTH) protein